MLKKILLGMLFLGLIGALGAGTVIRTIDRTELVAEARSNGEGSGQGGDGNGTGYGRSDGHSGDVRGAGRGRGGAGQGNAGNDTAVDERQYPNYTGAPKDWIEVEGIMVQAQGEDTDLVIQTNDGEEIVVGAGPIAMAEQEFRLEAGEQVLVRGYWDHGEFKAGQITRRSDGQTIRLRDDAGRPAWAGAGRNAQGGQGQGREDSPGDGTGTGQTNVEEWVTLQGRVSSVDADALVVETAAGEQVTVENRPWWFAQEQGFSTKVGDQISVAGFYENGDFEAGKIVDLTTGQSVLVRDESGRPLWAGQGRRGG